MSLSDHHEDHQFPRPLRGEDSALGRRALLKAAAALGAGAMVAPLARAQTASIGGLKEVRGRKNGTAKNVIFMVSDGMSFGTLTVGDLWIRRTRQERRELGGAWVGLWNRPGVRRVVQRTSSLDSLVTDSAAAGSAWGGGEHINNGSINVRPDGSQLLPILIHARQAGKATGVVSTARVTHATPASFYANSPRRDYEGMIAGELMERGIDIALGGGSRFFPESLLQKHAAVKVVRTREELKAAPMEGRLLGLFDDDHVPYVLDRGAQTPSLMDMSIAALGRLESKPEGFVLQIEAGRIDHAAHNNDAAALVAEQVEFDDTVGAVLEWMGERDDTLLIVTTDHGNANPGLTLYGEDGRKGLETLGTIRHSFDFIHEQTKDLRPASRRVEAFPEAVKIATGIELSSIERRMLVDVLNEQRVMPFANANIWTSVLGAIFAQHTGIAFISKNHSADHVELTAIGPGSEAFAGIADNTDAHGVMVRAMGLEPGQMLEGMNEKFKMPTPPKPD